VRYYLYAHQARFRRRVATREGAPIRPDLDSRYLVEEVLSDRDGRLTCIARDRLRGAAVIVKRDALERVGPELAALLALPNGIAPRVEDFLAHRDGTASLVLEQLRGRSLLEIAPSLDSDDMPRLVASICDALAALHRIGIVHADLKPAHVFLVGPAKRAQVRLIDLGSSLGLRSALDLDAERLRVGTPPFLAPELGSGWSVDERADQYSLAVVVRTLFPDVAESPPWRPILDRMAQPRPSSRYPDVRALAADLRHRFPAIAAESPPRFPAGPMRGREHAIGDLIARLRTVREPARILVSARPATGLSRFLLESSLAIVRAGLRPTRLLDLGCERTERWNTDALAAFVEAQRDAASSILCGVAPSSIAGTGTNRDRAIATVLAHGRWHSIPLEPLGARAYSEMIADSLGGGAAVESCAAELHRWSEGDLALASRGFAHVAARGSLRDGVRWGLPAEPTAVLLSDLSRETELPRISPRLWRALAVAARAGQRVPISLLRELLAFAGEPRVLDELLEGHWLLAGEHGSVSFATRRLRALALAAGCPNEKAVDRWLDEHLVPALDDPSQIRECALRARSLGKPEREAEYLREAFRLAHEEKRWDAVLELLAYPDPSGAPWTRATILGQASALTSGLGANWPLSRIVLVAAEALKSRDLTLAVELLEHVARESTARFAVAALVLLVENDLRTGNELDYARHMERLAAFEAGGNGPEAGVLDLKRAWHAQNGNRLDEAVGLATVAVERLSGTGSVHEVLSLQQLASLRASSQPEEAVRLLRKALRRARRGTEAAQVLLNLAFLHAQSGEIEACARAAEDGIRRLRDHDQPRLEVALREQRAWAMAACDRVAEAWSEAQSLLEHSIVRYESARTVMSLMLSGFCALHRGASELARSELARAFERAQRGCPVYLRASALRYLIDALLDLQAWSVVREHSESLDLGAASTDVATRLVQARARALRARAAGDLSRTIETLRESLADLATAADREAQARYLHHLGIAELERAEAMASDRSNPNAAVVWFQKAIRTLPENGHEYFRGRSMLGLSSALLRAGSRDEGTRQLDEVIARARRIGSRGLLADALRARAAAAVEPLTMTP
jgi:tetratricopeptide (TPR) repeat protein